VCGKGLDASGGMTLEGLRKQGYKAVFLGIGSALIIIVNQWKKHLLLGLPNPKKLPMFEKLNEDIGFYTSKDFLPRVSAASKPGSLHEIFEHSFLLTFDLCCRDVQL
jgi:dihydropyrimidine dehydrogenase (NADP+)